jgi:DNA polymerase epsilon subunit 1
MGRDAAGGGRSGTFGLTSNGRGSGRGRGTFKRRGGHTGRGGPRDEAHEKAAASLTKGAFDESTPIEARFQEAAANDEVDMRMGFERLEAGPSRQAWLVNMHPTIVRDADESSGAAHASGKSAVDFYFIDEFSDSFKVTVQYQPYMLVGCKPGTETHVEEWLLRRFEGLLVSCARQKKEDLKLPNHLVGHQRTYVKLSFHNVHDLLTVRREVLPLAQRAQKRRDAVDTYADVLAEGAAAQMELEVEDVEAAFADPEDGWTGGRAKFGGKPALEPEECIIDLREYDVPYYLRVAIDNGESRCRLCCGCAADARCGRHPRGHVVRRQLPRGRREHPLRAVACEACRAVRLCLRHRDDEAAPQISRRRDGRGDDDLVHDRRAGALYLRQAPPALADLLCRAF